MPNKIIKQIACGKNSTFLLTDDGSVYVCGRDQNYSLGLKNNNIVYKFQKIGGLENVEKMCVGPHHTVFITNEESSENVYVCGQNDSGQLGLLNKVENFSLIKNKYLNKKTIDAFCGYQSSAFLNIDGQVELCGFNSFGQLGIVDKYENELSDIVVIGHEKYKIKQVSLGWLHSAFLLENGHVFTEGYNSFGQLGRNGDGPSNFLKKNLVEKDVKQVVCNNSYTLYLMNDGRVKVSGLHIEFLSKYKDINCFKKPTYVEGLEGVRKIVSSPSLDFFIYEDNTLGVVGESYSGQAANGKYEFCSKEIEKIKNLNNVKDVAVGYFHTAILFNDGTVKVCGSNLFGQLGIGESISDVTEELVDVVI